MAALHCTYKNRLPQYSPFPCHAATGCRFVLKLALSQHVQLGLALLLCHATDKEHALEFEGPSPYQTERQRIQSAVVFGPKLSPPRTRAYSRIPLSQFAGHRLGCGQSRLGKRRKEGMCNGLALVIKK